MCFYKDLLRSTDFFFFSSETINLITIISEGLFMNFIFNFCIHKSFGFRTFSLRLMKPIQFLFTFYFLLFTFYLIKIVLHKGIEPLFTARKAAVLNR